MKQYFWEELQQTPGGFKFRATVVASEQELKLIAKPELYYRKLHSTDTPQQIGE